MKKLLVGCLPIFLILLSCQGIDTSKLPGFWLADKVEEEGKELDLDLSEISFEFKPNKRYSYYNTAYLSEDGVYETRGTTLYTTDTTGNNPMRKAVQIIHISDDSLHIRMNAAGKEQILYLYRLKETPDELDAEMEIDISREGNLIEPDHQEINNEED
jgi:hypothetical protein